MLHRLFTAIGLFFLLMAAIVMRGAATYNDIRLVGLAGEYMTVVVGCAVVGGVLWFAGRVRRVRREQKNRSYARSWSWFARRA